jgi:hypothetical protein
VPPTFFQPNDTGRQWRGCNLAKLQLSPFCTPAVVSGEFFRVDQKNVTLA